MKPIKVMIVDDHEVVRMGLRAAMEPEPDIDVVGEAGEAQAALREAEIVRPDVVLMDVRMPGTDGIECCQMLREALPETRVVMLTSYTDDEAVFASVMAGAVGYLIKNARREKLLEAVRSAAIGESLLDPSIVAPILVRLRALEAVDEDRKVALLSEREKEVLVLVANGMTNKEIAASLIISENTVRNHVSRMLEKLDFTGRLELGIFAAQHGLLDDQ